MSTSRTLRGTDARTRQLFNAGNYTAVAMEGHPDEWQTHAALGLIGKCRQAIEGLSRFDQPEARFYTAVAHWIDGDETAAMRILGKLDTPHARNLLALIRKPTIQVLAQLPWQRRPPWNLVGAIEKDPKFKVENVSFDSRDTPNEPYADVQKFYDANKPPDFYICTMVEWHMIPPNIRQLPCPILGQTADYDLQIQTVHPWLMVFDQLLVSDQWEWQAVSGMTRAPVATFPKVFGVADDLPPIPAGPREIGVFLSGTVLDPCHPDKARLLHRVLQAQDINVWTMNEFIHAAAYTTLLGHSKVSFCYVRHPNAMPTRGLEALSMGCAVAVQKGCVLNLYAGENEGVLTYEFESDDLVPTIRRILKEWPEFERRARRGAEIIRRELVLPRVASQYFRFLTFLAAKPGRALRKQPEERLRQKRPALKKGWIPGLDKVLQRIQKQNMARWGPELKSDATPHTLIDMARELVLAHAARKDAKKSSTVYQHLLSRVLELYRTGVQRFPKSLVLRFNLIRTALHFGERQDVLTALQLAEETVRLSPSNWQIDPMEDIFPFDFFNAFFNYRKYLDIVTEHLSRRARPGAELCRLILASLHHYLGHYAEDAEHFKHATVLDPDFPFYKLVYAEKLAQRDKPGDVAEAGALLTELAGNSVLFVEAFELLEQLQAEGRFDCPQFEDFARRVQRAHEAGLCLEEWRGDGLRYATPHAASASSESKEACRISALIPATGDERLLRALLEDLEGQSIAAELEIVVADSGSAPKVQATIQEFQRYYDNVVRVPTDKQASRCEDINRCIKVARGSYLTLALAGSRRHRKALARMARKLDHRPDVALVHGDVAVTDKDMRKFDPAHALGYYWWPEFNRRLLFQGCSIGPLAVWRRELHDRYGYFDAGFGPAAAYEFWLRIARSERFLHISELMGYWLPGKDGRADLALTAQDSERARARHWPAAWGPCPPLNGGYFVPATLVTASWESEVKALRQWKIISRRESADVQGILNLARYALARQDWQIAELALRAAIERFPKLHSVHLVLGQLLKSRGRTDEATEILEAALNVNAYEPAIARLLDDGR